MNNDDVKAYQEAIKRATQSKAFDRILHVISVVAFLCVAAYVVWAQAVYQSSIAKVSQERTQQYEELRISQEAIHKESENIKNAMACLKRLPVQPDEASITICVDKIKGEN